MYLQSERTLTGIEPITAQLHSIPSGVAGTLATLKIMWLLIKKGKISLPVRLKAVEILRNAGILQKDFVREIRALHAFVRDEIRYVKDIDGVETLHDAERVLRLGSGDCDDKSILLGSLLESTGHPVRVVAVGFEPGRYQHVYVEALIGRKWVPLETTEPVEMGWSSPRKPVMRMEYPPGRK